jgi:acyl-CoA thioesterase
MSGKGLYAELENTRQLNKHTRMRMSGDPPEDLRWSPSLLMLASDW